MTPTIYKKKYNLIFLMTSTTIFIIEKVV